jgi:hypothetical protein
VNLPDYLGVAEQTRIYCMRQSIPLDHFGSRSPMAARSRSTCFVTASYTPLSSPGPQTRRRRPDFCMRCGSSEPISVLALDRMLGRTRDSRADQFREVSICVLFQNLHLEKSNESLVLGDCLEAGEVVGWWGLCRNRRERTGLDITTAAPQPQGYSRSMRREAPPVRTGGSVEVRPRLTRSVETQNVTKANWGRQRANRQIRGGSYREKTGFPRFCERRTDGMTRFRRRASGETLGEAAGSNSGSSLGRRSPYWPMGKIWEVPIPGALPQANMNMAFGQKNTIEHCANAWHYKRVQAKSVAAVP